MEFPEAVILAFDDNGFLSKAIDAIRNDLKQFFKNCRIKKTCRDVSKRLKMTWEPQIVSKRLGTSRNVSVSFFSFGADIFFAQIHLGDPLLDAE